jgi:ATP-binding cassette subfamily F protein uup
VPVLSAQDLVKAYGARTLLDGVTLTIRQGERVGLVGNNGTGKTTLARLLAGIEPADAGVIHRRRGAQVEYLAQAPELPPELTAREVVLSGLSAWTEAKARYDAIVRELDTRDSHELTSSLAEAGAEIERLGGWEPHHRVDAVLEHLQIARVENRVGTMSGGERRRVALGRILVARPALAILDEPTNHLDVETIEWLEEHLTGEFPGALLLVTHDRYLLDRVAERTLELDRGKVWSYDGGYGEYLEAKAERLAHEARTEQNRQNFLRREIEWLRRQPKARTTKQKARIERAEDAIAIRAPQAEKTATLQVETVRTGKTVLEIRGAAIDVAGRRLVEPFELFLTKGERVGIVGPNGAGKTSLLRAVLGTLAPSAGSIVVGKNTRVAYLDQERTGLDDEASIFDNVAKNQRIEIGGQVVEPVSYLERFLFDARQQRQPVGSLSGGERARVALAKMLRESANLVVLDEPTNDLDVATLGALEEMLTTFDGTVLVVTHDRWFLDRIATSILSFEGAGKVVRYPGNYDTYRRLKASMETKPVEEAPKKSAKPLEVAPSAPPKPRKLTFAETKELDTIMERIDAAEAEVSALEAKMADPATYGAGKTDAKELALKLESARAEAARLVARWEELEARRG